MTTTHKNHVDGWIVHLTVQQQVKEAKKSFFVECLAQNYPQAHYIVKGCFEKEFPNANVEVLGVCKWRSIRCIRTEEPKHTLMQEGTFDHP